MHMLRSQGHPLAVVEQTICQQLWLLPVGGRHVLFAVSFLKGLTDPDATQLAHQRMLIGQPRVIILNYDAYDLSEKRQSGDCVWSRCGGSQGPVKAATLIAWNWRSRRMVLGEPGRTAVCAPPGSSSVMNLLGLAASTSRRGLASLCFKKLWKQKTGKPL